jgi:hypothetical protein
VTGPALAAPGLAVKQVSGKCDHRRYHQAPIGHLQPRARPFSAQSPAEQAEQQPMSVFDAQQQKLDRELDRRLNICRC